MADLKKTIDVILNGEDKASRQIRQVSDSVGGLRSRFGGIAKTGAAAATTIAAVGAAVSALVGAGLKQAFDQSVKLETAMVELEKVLGSQPEALDAAKKSAMELSNQYGISSEKIVNSIAGWVQAGYDVHEATKLAEESIALMYTSELDAAQATQTLTKIMKGFGLEVSESRSKLDVANEISNNYASSVGQLTEAMSRVAPIASAMGLSFEEMSSFLVPAIEKFQDGRRVGTAFAKILNNLVSDTGRVTDGLDTLGVSQKDANGNLRSGRDILYDVAQAFQDISPGQKTFVAQQLAGAEHSAKFLATMNSFDQVGAVYETAINSAGSVTEELQAQLESAQRQIDRWDKSWENLSATVGDQFRIAATEAYAGGTEVVNALQESVDAGAMEPFFDQLREMFGDLDEYLRDVAEVLPEAMEQVNWDGLAGSIGNVGDAFGGLFDDLDLTTAEGLAEAIQRIVNVGSNLIDFFANFIKVMDPVFSVIMTLIKEFNDLYDSISFVWNSAQATIGLAVSAILDWLQQLWHGLDSLPLVDFSAQIKSLQNMKDAVHGNVQKSLEDAATASDNLRRGIDDIPENKDVKVDVRDQGSTEGTQQKIKDLLPEGYDVGVRIEEDDSVQDIREKLKKLDEDKDVGVEVDDQGTTEETKKEVDQIPEEKDLQVSAELEKRQLEEDIARIEAQADLAGEALKYQAQVDIADIEAGAEKMRALAESTAKSFQNTGDVIGKIVGSYTDAGDTFQEYRIQSWIEQEQKRRDELLDTQKELTQAEIDYTQAKTDALRSGDGEIKIEAAGLEPELEAFMWKIIERVQIRANEEASEFLLGVG